MESPAIVNLFDEGADGLAGDGVYGASIPNTAYSPGQMVRYYLLSTDSANNQARQPPLGAPRTPSAASR